VESRVLVLPDGTEITGEDLERRLERLIAFRKYLQIVERRGPSREVVVALLEREAREKGFFADRARVEALAAALSGPLRTASVQEDEEHQAFAIAIEDRTSGYPRHHRVDQDFVTTGEFRTLAASYQDVKGIRGPMVVKTTAHGEPEEAAADDAATGGDTGAGETAGTADEAARPAAEQRPAEGAPGRLAAKASRNGDVHVESIDDLVEFFTAAGKKGVAINRYKGLGEMNPDTLWATTMNPEQRSLAQVRAEDHMEADLMFTTLMGDQVEPRRKFIEDNALDVKNLDI
jgi:DNA gyrase subunit B